MFSQSDVFELEGFGQFTAAILALKMGVQPVGTVVGQVVALVADLGEFRRTQSVHALGPRLLAAYAIYRHRR